MTDEHSTQMSNTHKHDSTNTTRETRRKHLTETMYTAMYNEHRARMARRAVFRRFKSWVAGRQRSSLKSCVRERVVVVRDVLRTNCRILGSAQRSNPGKNL